MLHFRGISFSIALALGFAVTACSDGTSTAPLEPDATLVIAQPGIVRDGDVLTIRAELRRADGQVITDPPVQWTSTDPSVATISPQGVLTAIREGTTDIVAVSGARSARRALQVVLHPATAIELASAQVEVAMGTQGSLQVTLRGLDGRVLRGRPLEITSDNPQVVRIGDNGAIVPVAPGITDVRVRYGTLSAVARVRVPGAPASHQYAVIATDGRALPAILDERIVRTEGEIIVREITRLEGGSLVLNDGYTVTLTYQAYEQVEFRGAFSERRIGSTTVRDRGRVTYDWITGDATLESTDVGGLRHAIVSSESGLRLRFREGGTETVRELTLRMVGR